MDRNDIKVQRIFAQYRACGIFIEEKDNNVVTIEQRKIFNSRTAILSQRDLIKRARTLYPEKEFKIVPITYKIDHNMVTPSWIKEQMTEFFVKPKDLANQLGFNQSEISLFLNGERTLSRGVRSSFYYYFLARKIQRDLGQDLEQLEKKNDELESMLSIDL